MAEKLSREARTLEKGLRDRLRTASDTGQISNPVAEVLRFVQVTRNGADEVIAVPRGTRNFKRDDAADHFERDDGAHFDLAITLRDREVVAWSFELRFPLEWDDGPRWVRFDLNHPGHANDERGLRCHVHLGSDDDGSRSRTRRMAPSTCWSWSWHACGRPDANEVCPGTPDRWD